MARPLSPEKFEARLTALERKARNLEVEARASPFESLEFQLALENGHTVSARTRRMPMSMISAVHDNDLGGSVVLTDGATTELRMSAPIPSDWVVDTEITLNIMVYKAGANNEVAVINTWIASLSDGETFSWNINSNTSDNQTIPASSELHTYTRTVTGTSISADEVVTWLVRRTGGSGDDTLNEDLIFRFGPWLEYTAFF